MKTFKPNTYGFSIKSFGLQNITYLTTTILVFFDLTDPGSILTEQEMWAILPEQLGPDTLADLGFPKPHGEVLVTGSCFSPNQEPVAASEVEVRVGDFEKKLLVFGNRTWQPGNIPSHPEAFVELPITWNNSYGGQGYDRNPSGKGYKTSFTQIGGPLPLPNIENERLLVGSPNDQPEPACFAPLDMSWPQRFQKCGTYGGKWLEERWPWFPDDFNPEFFNTAPEDQFVNGFFQGEEKVIIKNMHPALPLIVSQLPGQRPRCFVTRKKELSPDAESEFVEVHHQIDTVWLFPKVLRGLVLYRGTLEVLDDEYGDIERIYVAAEQMAEQPKTIEQYWQEQKKFWDRSVDIDLAPLEKAKGKVADMLKKMRQMPKQIEQAKLKAMGKAPRMQRTPAEMGATARKHIAQSHDLLDDQEAMARRMHAKHGHLVNIDLTMFHRMRQTLNSLNTKIDTVLAKASEAQKKKEVATNSTAKHITANIPAAELEKAGINPDDLLPQKKINPWHDHGFPLVIGWRKNLELDEATQQQLADFGFQQHTIKHSWLGVNHKLYDEEMADWGEKKQLQQVPAGLVMPRFFEATLTSVRVRHEIRSGQQGTLIPGSKAPPLFLPALEQGCPVIIIGDELEALLVEQELGDCCSVIALHNPSDQLDELSQDAIANSSAILFVIQDGDDGKPKNWDAWLQLASQAQPAILPTGMDLYDLHRKIGLRPWLMEKLPDTFAAANNVELALPEQGKIPDKSPLNGLVIPKFDIKNMVKQFSSELKQFHQPTIDKMEAMKKTVQAQAAATMVAAGQDPAVLLQQKPPTSSYDQQGKNIGKNILAQRDKLKGQGTLSPENEKKMTQSAAQALEMGADGEKRYQDGTKKLANGKAQIAQVKAGKIPDNIQASLAAKGIDPERLKKLSREDVQARYQQGLSLAGTNFSEVDLSGMDLSGADFSRVQCRKTIFKQCTLKGALFEQTIAQEADFSEADLSNCTMNKALMNKAKFSKTHLDGSTIKQSLFKRADCTEASFNKANISMSIFQKSLLTATIFDQAIIEMSTFSDAKATGASFAGCILKKCLFKRTVVDQVDFSGTSFPSTLLHGAQGVEVNFRDADFTKGRMAGNAQFQGADFSGITMEQGSFLDSNLSGSTFTGALISSSLVENCDFTKANLAGISAQKTRFKRSNFEQANLRGINLYCGSLKKARLVATDLSCANLFGVDFFKSITGKTNFDGSNLKRTLLHKRTEFLQ